MRYTTIYLANKTQINNPDRILPGQVFGVPNEALPNAEQLHWQRMHGETDPVRSSRHAPERNGPEAGKSTPPPIVKLAHRAYLQKRWPTRPPLSFFDDDTIRFTLQAEPGAWMIAPA